MYGLEARGVDGSAPPPTRVEDMAAQYVEDIRAVQPEGPYFLAGYCLGGTIAFEMAHQLAAQGHEVGLLALIETFATKAPQGAAGLLPRLRRRTAFELDGLARAPARLRYVLDRGLEQVSEAATRTRRALARARHKETSLDRVRLRVESELERAFRSYVPRRYPGRLILFRPTRPPARSHHDPLYGWGPLAREGVTVHEVPGRHPAMVYEPRVRLLASQLRACLANAQVERSRDPA